MSGPEAAELWLKAMISLASEDGSPQTFDTTALSSLQASHALSYFKQCLHLNHLGIPIKAFSVYRNLNICLTGHQGLAWRHQVHNACSAKSAEQIWDSAWRLHR